MKGTPRRSLGGLAAATFVLWSLVGLVVGQTVPEFEDVPEGHIAQSAIEWAASNGITVGVGNNRFGMGQTLNRYEMVTFLCRAFDSDNCRSGTKGSERFADVPVDHWANYSVGWAVNGGITSGVSATEFGGSQTLSREEMITFLYKAKGSPTGGSKGSDIYEDVPNDRSEWANLPIGWAFDQRITGGIDAGTFGFGTSLPREEMVLFLCRTVAPEVCTPSQVPIAVGGSQETTGSETADCVFTDHVARVSEAVYQVHAGDGIGTAFYIGNGEWLTAAHVLQNQSTVTLRRGGASLTATVLGTDLNADLALLQAAGSNISPLMFGQLSEIGQGHPLFSVGFPVYVATEPSVTSGVLSRVESHPDLGTVVVTDTAVSPGNSGGPLLNKCGEVIGLFVAKIVSEEVEGISYAVAESTLKQRLPELRVGGSRDIEDSTGSDSSGDVGSWTYFSGETFDGKYEGYHLVAVEHDGYSWELSPVLFLRCGISNVVFDAIFIATEWLIQSDVGEEGDVVVEYRFTSMTSPVAEWWWSNEEFDSTVFVYNDTTQIVEHLGRAASGSLWVRIWDGFSDETNSMRFEIHGVQSVLSDLGCLN